MDEEKAKSLAVLFGAESWASGGGEWVVLLTRADGRLLVFSERFVSEFEDFAAFEEGVAITEIIVR